MIKIDVKRNKKRMGKILLLVAILLIVGLAAAGCVSGLQPVGWSGGTVSNGVLYVGSKEGRLVSINITDETRQWSEPFKKVAQAGGFGCLPTGGGCESAPAGVAIYGTPAVAGDLAYIGGYNGKFYAFVADGLTERWVYPRDEYLEPIIGGPVVGQGKVFFGDSNGKVYALDAATGDKQWEFPTGDKIWAAPAFADDTVFIGSFDKKLYALWAANGAKKWEFATDGAIAATPLVYNGTVYFGSFDRYFYAVDAATGAFKWKFMAENWFWAKPVAYDDVIYAASLDGKVYALQADNGNKVAEFDLGSPVSASPVIVGDSIIFASQKGVVYSIDAVSKQLKQLSNIKEDVYGPLAAAEGIVYIHTADLTLRRINASTGAILISVTLESVD